MSEIKGNKKPKFLRPNYGRTKRSRVKGNWRKPRGIDNKKRIKRKFMGASPSIGYGRNNKLKEFHPSGLLEVRVHNASELEGVTKRVVRIAGGVGVLKRKAIMEKAKAMGLRVLN